MQVTAETLGEEFLVFRDCRSPGSKRINTTERGAVVQEWTLEHFHIVMLSIYPPNLSPKMEVLRSKLYIGNTKLLKTLKSGSPDLPHPLTSLKCDTLALLGPKWVEKTTNPKPGGI